MAHAFVYRQPFLTASIVGATKIEQLETAIRAYDLELSEEVLKDLEEIHTRFPYPCP